MRRWLRIGPEEATFARRGFRCSSRETQSRLERVGESFLYGYHAALEDRGTADLAHILESMQLEFRGFAYEGAAMALDIQDQIKPRRGSRVRQFLQGPGAAHVYMVHVGMGWSMARLPFRWRNRLSFLDPLLRWLVLDGYGFHEGYFHWPRCRRGRRPEQLRGYGLRAFDQGLGRSLWFVSGADPEWIGKTIATFSEARRPDLWSGAGLACAYAGAAGEAAIQTLRTAAGTDSHHLAQGAVFAAGARQRAGNPVAHTDLACQVLCGISSGEAAALSDETLSRAKADYEPAYEVWRRLIRAHFREREVVGRFPVEDDFRSHVRLSGLRERSEYVQ